MSNFKEFLDNHLAELGRLVGTRLGYKDISRTSGLARGTFYNWANGGPASAESMRKFVGGLAALGKDTPYRAPTVAQVAAAIDAPDPRAVAKTPLAFINYGPIVQQSAGAGSFLGGLIRQFAAVSQICEAIPDSEEPGFGLDDIESPLAGDHKALVGAFMMPHRASTWAALRLPLQMPLNAVLLQRDVTAFIEHVHSGRFGRASRSADEYLRSIEELLWCPRAGQPAGLMDDLHFVVAHGEAGDIFLRRMHDPRSLQGVGSTPEAALFHERLWERSEAFHDSLTSGPAGDADRRLPILVADELTCLDFLLQHVESTKCARTAAVLLSGQIGAAQGNAAVVRPCFPISVLFRREHPGERGYGFEIIQEEFREFVVSFRGMITDEYVRLHGELCARFEGLANMPAASLILNWMSLEGAIRRADSAPPATAVLGDLPDIEHWRGILDGAARTILASDLGPSVRGALGLAATPAVADTDRA